MYLGKIVETAPRAELFEHPLHPYTRALLASVPRPDPGKRHSLNVLSGDVPSPVNVPAGCHFHPRCSEAMAICREAFPATVEVRPGHRVACHLYPAAGSRRSA
jgi:oligopeptide/dipeptide ABC transporter ATP-binding protein